MAEALLINPRRRRGRRKKARSSRRKRARARRNPFAANRRSLRRRSSRRARARRNPSVRIPLLGSINLNAIGGGFAGYLGTRYASTWAISMLPPDWKTGPNAPMARIGVKAVLGFAVVPMLARMLGMRGVAGPLAIGAGIAVVQDLVDTFAPNILPMPAGVTSLADYETQTISSYETAALSDDGGGAYGGGAYGMSAY